MMMTDILILVLLVLTSAFFSGTEIAFVVGNKIKVEIKARKNNFAAKNALSFTNNPQNFFSTILLGNNIVNITFASMSTLFLESMGLSEFIILTTSTLILLIFGELVPKYFSTEIADRVILFSAIPLKLLSYILYPFVKVTTFLSSLITRTKNIKEGNINYLFTKEDFESLVKESKDAGVVNKKESDIISRVLDVGEQRVYEAMRPRTDIVGLDINCSISEALNTFIESGYSKLPVYEESLDNIKGVIFAYDLYKNPENLQSIIRNVIFVPDTKKSLDMLNEFLTKRVSIAIVIDEFGGTAGLVTMEDIIEELFGEIKDEYDVEENICRKISKDTFLISGKVEVDYINEKYNLNLPYGDYETLGGYITTELGRIPAQGENVEIDGYNILIARADNTHIDIVKLTVPEGTESGELE